MSNFNLEVPINSVSFGQVSVNLLKEIYKRELNPCIFPIGGKADLSSFEGTLEEDFLGWVDDNIKRALRDFSKHDPSLKLWHINGAQNSISKRQVLFTFHETDCLTGVEKNILKNQDKILVSSQYTKSIFKAHEIDNVDYCALGFDKDSFGKTNKKYMPSNVTSWAIYGKLENRKRHLKTLKVWAEKFGNNAEHFLNLCVFNPFIKPEAQAQMINSTLGKKYFNINVVPFTKTNKAYNDVLNASDVVLSLSGGEGFDLPLFQSLCLGKHAVVLKGHVYLDYTHDGMVEYVEPEKKIECYDNVFFHKGGDFNQGNIFDYNEECLVGAMNKAFDRVKKNKVNTEGLTLKDNFTYSKTCDKILSTLGV